MNAILRYVKIRKMLGTERVKVQREASLLRIFSLSVISLCDFPAGFLWLFIFTFCGSTSSTAKSHGNYIR